MEIYKSKNIFKKIEKLLYALAGQGAVYIYEQCTEDGYKSTNGVVKTNVSTQKTQKTWMCNSCKKRRRTDHRPM